jgi:hypothetical protein
MDDDKMEKLIFSSLLFPGESSEGRALLLAESIRAFAGSLSKSAIWYFAIENRSRLSESTGDKLLDLGVTLKNCTVPSEILGFPLAVLPFTAALAESVASDRTEFLAWLSSDTLVLQEPKEFLLQDNKTVGVRPVHHTLVGSRYEEPLDPFWTQIYRYFDVPQEHVFPMTAHVDGVRIRPYFNAGHLVVRPERGLLRAWHDSFLEVYQLPAFREFYRRDGRYATFIHQAVLAGMILAALPPEEIQVLPSVYNYPLHLYTKDVTDSRPSSLEELVTFRYESFFEDPEWDKKIPAGEPLKRWIAERLEKQPR